MSERLATLRAMLTQRPVLSRNGDITVALIGTHPVQFTRDEEAAFFVEAYNEVPALIERVRELEAQVAALGQGALEEMRERVISTERVKQLLVQALDKAQDDRAKFAGDLATARRHARTLARALLGTKKSSQI